MSFFEQLCGFCEFQGHLSGHRPLRHKICITSVADHRLPMKTVKQGDSMLCQDKALFVTGVLVRGGQQAGLWACHGHAAMLTPRCGGSLGPWHTGRQQLSMGVHCSMIRLPLIAAIPQMEPHQGQPCCRAHISRGHLRRLLPADHRQICSKRMRSLLSPLSRTTSSDSCESGQQGDILQT